MKTKHVTCPTDENAGFRANGKPLKRANDCKYPGLWVDTSAKDKKVGNALKGLFSENFLFWNKV